MVGPTGVHGPFPLASAPEWQAFRDAFYAVLLAPRGGSVERADRRLVAALARLRAEPDTAPLLAAWVFEAGSEMGRHVVSKRLVDDSREQALAALADALRSAGAAHVRRQAVFHRTLSLTIEPGEAGRACDADVLASFVAGLLAGSFGEAFNCLVSVDLVAPWTFEAKLGEGREVSA